MTSPQCTVPDPRPPVRTARPRPVPARPLSALHLIGGAEPARGARSTPPGNARRDPVRPGARPVRLDEVAGPRPVRGGCAPVRGVTSRVARGGRVGHPAQPPLRLTRRGRRAVAALSVAIGVSIGAVTVAVELADAEGGLQLAGSATVVVQPGDTLWSLATELAPQEDPRAVVDAIVDLNDLAGTGLMPGQRLELP